MKKKILLIIFIIIIAVSMFVISLNYFISKVFENPVIASLSKCDSSDCYYGEGFQDYTDYCKYYYEKYKEKYDFRKDCIDVSDYFYIENKDTYEKYANYPDKYSAYNVYFFDVQTKTLFYIHSNI